MSRFSRTVSSVSSVSCCGTTPSRRADRAARRVRGSMPRTVERAVGDRRDAADHPHRRGLAGAVRAEEAERLAGRDVEVDGVDRGELAEPLRQAAGMDERWCRSDRRGRDRGRARSRPHRRSSGMGAHGTASGGRETKTCYSAVARNQDARTANARSPPMAAHPRTRRGAARRSARRRADRRRRRTADPSPTRSSRCGTASGST